MLARLCYTVLLDEAAGRREAEAKISQMTVAFEEALREQAEQLRVQFCTENEEAAVDKINCLEREIENLKASHTEAMDIVIKREEAKARTDAHTIRQLQHRLAQLQAQSESQRWVAAAVLRVLAFAFRLFF